MRLVAVSLSLLAFGAVTNNVVVVQGYVVAPAAVRFFATSSTVSTRMRMTNEHHHTTTNDDSPSPADLDIILSNNQNNQNWATTLATTATTTALLWPSAAVAAGPDWGLFEGRIGSLLHPLTMGSLFVFSLYTAFLGWQWRRQRTLGDEISSLKQQQTSSSSSSSSSGGDDMAVAAVLSETRALSNLDLQIQALQNERKQLAASGPRDKHFSQGALLACVGTLFAIEGPLNTYARAGKLFPGPHLYAGAGLVCLWAIAVACVPAMQKGNDTARSVHICANAAGLGLFGWQIVSGIPILLKVVEKTAWP